MFGTLARFEFKNLMRNNMTVTMILFPILLGGLGRLLLARGVLSGDVANVVAVALIIVAGFAFGSMAGFSLLDDRDDMVFESISISPVSLLYYIWFKVVFAFVLATIAGVGLMLLVGSFTLTPLQMLLVALLGAMQVPINAFIINAFATNKVEGFVSMKATGFLIICPIAAWFFLDWKEWLFAVAPGFWPAKALQTNMIPTGMNMGFWGYIAVGCLVTITWTVAMYAIFRKKNAL